MASAQINELAAAAGPAASGAAALKALRGGGYFSAAAAPDAAGGSAGADAEGRGPGRQPLPPLVAKWAGDLEAADEGAAISGGGGGAARVAEAGLQALGLMLQFLRDGLLDAAVLPHARYAELGAEVGAGGGWGVVGRGGPGEGRGREVWTCVGTLLGSRGGGGKEAQAEGTGPAAWLRGAGVGGGPGGGRRQPARATPCPPPHPASLSTPGPLPRACAAARTVRCTWLWTGRRWRTSSCWRTARGARRVRRRDGRISFDQPFIPFDWCDPSSRSFGLIPLLIRLL